MKLSDLIAQVLHRNGLKYVFAVSGGASLHLIHSIAETEGIEFICPQHEQGGAMAADGYSRVSKEIGCAIATSGPGATNLITGIATSFYDSIPILFLTGQVASFRFKGNSGVRQMGFQETDIVSMCQSITKYAKLITEPYSIIYEIEKAIHIAKNGRPGPVLIDIPDDIQRMEIDPTLMKQYHYIPQSPFVINEGKIHDCINLLKQAKRPVLIAGWGVHLSNSEDEFRELANFLQIPVVSTWAARDLYQDCESLFIGGFGTHGTRAANYTVQNSDLILSVGSRLDTKATGSPASSFARGAKIIMVDIDPSETKKFNNLDRLIDISINNDANEFLTVLLKYVKLNTFPSYSEWRCKTLHWVESYPVFNNYEIQKTKIDPYFLVEKVSNQLEEDDIIFSDTGGTLAWFMQGLKFKKGQRFFHSFNNTPMGYGLPAAIGGSFARPCKRIILLTGDGSFQMSIQELATLIRHKLPIKIILLNNGGHGMVRQTQEMWLGGKFYATSEEGGLPSPNFTQIVNAYGITSDTVEVSSELELKLKNTINHTNAPTFLNINIDRDVGVSPQVKYGRPNEDGHPLLNRSEFLENMLIEPLPVSLKGD